MRLSISAIVLIASNSLVVAEEPAAAFIPAKAGVPAMVVYETGDISPVVDGIDGKPPSNCPQDGFWLSSQIDLVKCADGTSYRAVPMVAGDKFTQYENALKLLAIEDAPPRPIPGGGTDKPGPSRGDKTPKKVVP